VRFSVSLDHLGLVLLVSFVGFVFFSTDYRAKRLAGKNVSELTYFVSSGTLNLAPSIASHFYNVSRNFLSHEVFEIFSRRLRIYKQNFTRLSYVRMYATSPNFTITVIQLFYFKRATCQHFLHFSRKKTIAKNSIYRVSEKAGPQTHDHNSVKSSPI